MSEKIHFFTSSRWNPVVYKENLVYHNYFPTNTLFSSIKWEKKILKPWGAPLGAWLFKKYLQSNFTTSGTPYEFIKCRFLNILIIECCSYLVFQLNNYMELFKTVLAYLILFLQLLWFMSYCIKPIERFLRRHFIQSFHFS